MRDRRWLGALGVILTVAACGSSGGTGARGGAGGGGASGAGGGGAGGSGGGVGGSGGGAGGSSGMGGGAGGSVGGAGAVGGLAGGGAGGSAGTGTQASCAISQPFKPRVQAVVGTSTSSEDGASVSADGLSAVVSSRANANIQAYTLSVYSRGALTEMFANPQPFGDAAANLNVREPRLTRDGLSLFFDDDTASVASIWRATRDSATGSFDANFISKLPATINSATESTYGPWVSSDGARLYFERSHVLYLSTIAAGQFGAPAAVSELNAGGTVLFPVLTDDERTVYFGSERQAPSDTGPSAAFRIWTSRRAGGNAPWGAPSYVSEVNNGDSIVPTDVSPDGCILYVVHNDGQSHGRVEQAVKPAL